MSPNPPSPDIALDITPHKLRVALGRRVNRHVQRRQYTAEYARSARQGLREVDELLKTRRARRSIHLREALKLEKACYVAIIQSVTSKGKS